jgi:Lar family restriction alleviation protein
MSEELKPCPFCGGEPKTSHRPESEAGGGGHVAFVVCYCGGYSSTAHQMGHAETVQAAIAEAIEKWNTRTQLASTGGEPPYQWPTFEEWLEYELDGSGIDPDSIKGDTRLYASRAYFCAGHMHNRIVAAMQPAPAGVVVPRELLALAVALPSKESDEANRAGIVARGEAQAAIRALLNQAGGE